MTEFVLRGDRVVLPDGERRAAIHVSHGRIAAIAAHDDVPAGWPVVDAGGAAILPGVVDSHVHVNEPGRTEWEGFESATKAAAAGGVTALVDMPLNSIPATTTLEAFQEKKAAAAGKMFVDVGFWGGVVPGNAGEVRPLVDAGVLGFKCFLVDSGVAEFQHVEEADLRQALRELRACDTVLLAHAELPGPIERAAKALAAKGIDRRSYRYHLEGRPKAAEDEAVALLVALCREYKSRTHVVHHCSSTSLQTLRAARDEGLPFSAETCPHYLTFAAEEIPDGATWFKCTPPIREAANREALWGALQEGVIESVVSDHSPCAPALKGVEKGDFEAAWGGVSGLQLGLTATWTGARARGATLNDLARWMSAAPAKLAGLKSKGAIEVGKDADLIVFDADAPYVVDAEHVFHRHKLTPYAGRPLQGVVRSTYVRGARVWDGAAHAAAPVGRALRREA